MTSPLSRSSDLEIRTVAATALDMDGSVIRGYPIVFNKLSQDLGGFKERICSSAVDRSINADIRALVDHDTAKILGRTRSGTLRLRKDKTGLRMELEPDPEISYAKDILRSVARGDVSGMSFGFKVIADDWTETRGQLPTRDVLDMEIMEVTIATFPAYLDTNVEVAQRSLVQFHRTHVTGYDWRSKWHEIQTGDL